MQQINDRPVKNFIAALACIFYASIAFGQTNLYFESIRDAGMSTPVTRAIVQDNSGFVYVGSNDGFFKYDGFRFKKYSSVESGNHACPINNIRSLYFDGENIWIGGTEGLAKFNPASDIFSQIALENTTDERTIVRTVRKYSATEIVAGAYRSFHIINIKTNAVTAVLMPADFPEGDLAYVTALCVNKNGDLWAGTNRNGLYLLKQGAGIPTLVKSSSKVFESVSGSLISDIAPGTGDEILIGTGSGLFALNISGLTCRQIFLHAEEDAASEPVIKKILAIGEKGEYFITTYGNGFYQYNTKENKSVQYAYDKNWYNGVSDNYLNDVFEGKNHIYWIATENTGIIKLNTWFNKYEYVLVPPPLGADGLSNVTDIQAMQHRLFLATSLGLYEYTADRQILYHDASSLYTDSYLQNLHRLNETYLVFEVWGEGVGIYNIKTNSFGFLQLPGNNIMGKTPLLDWMSFTDKEENYYFADFNGNYLRCNYLQNTTDTLFTKKEVNLSLPIVIPKDATQLYVISGSKLYAYNTQTKHLDALEHDKTGRHLPPIAYQDEMLVRNDKLYFASDEGLFVYDTRQDLLTKYGEESGLLSANCFSVFESNKGEIMIPYEGGIAKFDEKQNRLICYIFPNLIGTSPNPSYDEAGNFYYGADYFFIRMPADSMKLYPEKPLMHILSLKAGNKIFDLTQLQNKIVLRHTDFPLEIEYELIDYLFPFGNKIKYTLTGWDKDWITNENTDSKTMYSKLSAGEYEFKIEGANAAGNLAPMIRIPIHVLPPFWQTWWFIALIILSILLVPLAIYRYRLDQLKKIQVIRNKIAGDLHDDVGSTLSSIRMYSDIVSTQVKNKNPESIPLLEKMSSNSGEMIENMSDIVWAIKPANDAFKNIESRMLNFAVELCNAKNIELRMERNEALDMLRIKMEQRKDLYLIFKEAVNNAVKYSACSRIIIQFSKSNKELVMSVSDNGKGFDLQNLKSGNGLGNMKKRAENQKGKLEIITAENAGTTIQFTLSLN